MQDTILVIPPYPYCIDEVPQDAMSYPDFSPQIDAFFPGVSTTIFRRSTMAYNDGVTEA